MEETMTTEIWSKRAGLVMLGILLLCCSLQSAIDWGKEGVAPDAPVTNILQITPGDPAAPEADVEDSIPCWGVNPWSYDGEWIVYQSRIGEGYYKEKNEICIIKSDGTDYQRLTNNNICDSHGNFTPDGQKIVFQREVEPDVAEVWIMNRDGSNQRSLTQIHTGPVVPDCCEQKPMVSPDGTKIAFRVDSNGTSADIEQIWVMNIDGTAPKKVSGNLVYCSKHSWSPDSGWILFNSRVNDYSRIFKVRADGSELTMLSEDIEGGFCENWAAWSPDGKWISYHRGRKQHDISELWIMKPDGTGKEILIAFMADEEVDGEWVCAPHSWSPDSEWIAFKKKLDDDMPLYLINIKTRKIQQLTAGYGDGRMWWAPAGNTILFREKDSASRDEGKYHDDLLVLSHSELCAWPNNLGGGSGCFIATAAFGSPFERHVVMLREFRDRCLLNSSAGRAFVRWYYRHSPKYAAIIAHNDALRAVARIALMPLYGMAVLILRVSVWLLLFVPAVFLAKKLIFLRRRGDARQ